jgi:hypothetical protein
MMSKKLYVLIAAVATIAAVLLAFFIPQGAAIIPLEVNYTVGEKMVYSTTQQITMLDYSSPLGIDPPNTVFNSTSTVEVTGFDGQYYTLNHTTKVVSSSGSSLSIPFSFIQKINKEGYTVNIFQGDDAPGNATANPFIVGLLNRSEVKVGDTWTIPIENTNPAVSCSGSITITFQGFEDITVPAGTFRVFKANSVSSVFAQMTPVTFNDITSTTTLTISQNGTMYVEYSSCRQIKSTIQQVIIQQSLTNGGSVSLPSSNYTSLLTANIELIQDIQL